MLSCPDNFDDGQGGLIGERRLGHLIRATENANMNDPHIWAIGGRLKQVWKEALASNNARAQATKEALDVRLAEINKKRPEEMEQPVVHLSL